MQLHVKQSLFQDKFWLLVSWLGVSVIYFSLVWKTTASFDRVVTDGLFAVAIAWRLWRKPNNWHNRSWSVSSFVGLVLLCLILTKTFTLFSFEYKLIFLLPTTSVIALILLISGFQDLIRYSTEIFLAWFLFFPTEVIGTFIEQTCKITVITAKIATYILYYLGFQVTNQYNEVILYLPSVGQVKAIVNFSCTGIMMMLLLLKLALIVITCSNLSKRQKLLLPLFALGLGFSLGVIRVCLLTLVIRNSNWFDYWHGSQGTQIFSTIAILGFALFCQHVFDRSRKKVTSSENYTHNRNLFISNSNLLKAKLAIVSFRWRNYFLIASAAGVNLLAIYAWNMPLGSPNLNKFQFPPLLKLNTNTVAIASSYPSQILPLVEPSTEDLTQPEMRWNYQQYQLRDAQSPINIEINYITNTRGEVNTYLQRYTSFTKDTIDTQTSKQLVGVGYHTLFTSQNRAYLNSCISPRSLSNINQKQFSHHRYQNDLKFKIAWQWLLGKASIRDRRCLWINISVPIYTDTQTAYQQLEKTWQDLYQWWLPNFPPL